MLLTDQKPKWLNEHMFVFLCPHCNKEWLSCKTKSMRSQEQFDLFEAEFGEDWNLVCVPSRGDYAWRVDSRDFSKMSVTPSLDASPSGHWHGHITNGQIVG